MKGLVHIFLLHLCPCTCAWCIPNDEGVRQGLKYLDPTSCTSGNPSERAMLSSVAHLHVNICHYSRLLSARTLRSYRESFCSTAPKRRHTIAIASHRHRPPSYWLYASACSSARTRCHVAWGLEERPVSWEEAPCCSLRHTLCWSLFPLSPTVPISRYRLPGI